MKASVLILVLMVATSAASAGTITSTLCDTGVATGCAGEVALTPINGAVDSNFTITTAPTTGTYYALTYYNAFYLADTTTADWITTASGPTTSPTLASAVGLYNYQETITTNGPGMFTFTGDWATDNCGTILVNGSGITGTGTTIGGGAAAGCSSTNLSYFQSLTAFSFTVTLNSGTNYLDFNVWNSAVSPTALFVENLAASPASSGAVPEPSSVLLTVTGLSLLAVAIIRRRRAGNRTCS